MDEELAAIQNSFQNILTFVESIIFENPFKFSG
jgi:hypothetical protein